MVEKTGKILGQKFAENFGNLRNMVWYLVITRD